MDDIKKLVRRLVRKYQTRDPFEIIKGLNVILIFTHLEGIRGFYQYFQRNNIIYIDEDLPDSEKRFVCAHELGHMFLHKKINTVFMDSRTFMPHDKFERQANIFAADLLIPDDILSEAIDQGYTDRQLARLVGCCEELVRLRLNHHDFVSGLEKGNPS